MQPTVIPLEIARVRFDVASEDGALLSRLRTSYGPFVTAERGGIRVSLAGEPAALAGNPSGEVVREDEELRLRMSPQMGFLDRRRGQGTLRPHPSLLGLDMLLRAEITLRALEAGGVALHACGVELRGRAHVFAGPSGAGKTTLAGMLEREGARVLSDEMMVVRPGDDGRWWAYGTPYRYGTREGAPLHALWRLRHGPRSVRALTRHQAHRHLVGNLSLCVRGDVEVELALAGATRLAAAVDAHELTFSLTDALRDVVEAA
ncbi:MAG: hypothetical protein AB2A00_27365 [Myxococcota bacterium]